MGRRGGIGLRGLVVACVALGAYDCTPSARLTLAPPDNRITAVAVEPLRLDYAQEPYAPAQRTHQLLQLLWDESAWLVLGPHQFRELQPNRPPLRGTNLVVVANQRDVDPHTVAVLSGRLSLREARSQAQLSGPGGRRSGHGYQGEVLAALTLQDINGAVIAESRTTEPIDPFAEADTVDPLPAATRALQRAARTLVEATGAFIEARRGADLPAATNPGVLLHAKSAQGATLARAVERAGPLRADQLLWSTLRFLEPEMSIGRAQALARAPEQALGWCFRERYWDLPAGTCVFRVDGTPVYGVHALGWLLRRSGPVTLDVVLPSGESRRATIEL